MKITKQNRNLIILIILASSILWCLCLFFTQINIKKSYKNLTITNSHNIRYEIEEINYEKGMIGIKGWALRPSEEIEFPNIKVLLKNDNDPFYIEPKTMMCQNHQISDCINNGMDYTNSGFYTRIFKSHLHQDGKYKVYLWYHPQNDNILTDTGIEISNITAVKSRFIGRSIK